ncbi:MAG: transposase [Pseudolabrys sp.]|jgi:transposase
MTKAQVEVITSVQRRRRWSSAEKEQIVAAAIEPGAVASEVARAAGIQASQLFRWRRQLCGSRQDSPTFTPVTIVSEPGSASSVPSLATPLVIEIKFATGARMRLTGPIEASAMSALIATLAKYKRRR